MTDTGNLQNWRLETDADRVTWLTFDKDDASTNVLSGHIMIELEECIRKVAELAPRALVIQSAKKSGFVAGADINEFTDLQSPAQAFDLIRRGQLVLEELEKLPFPTIALIHGFALGGGLELALACKYRIAVDDSRTSLGLPEVKLGIHPGFGGTVRSVRCMGVIQAMDMMLTGRFLSASKALRSGLVDKLVPAESLKEEGKHLALNPPPPRQAPFLQRLLNFGLFRPFVARALEKQVKQKVRHDHYPAPYAIIDLWKRFGGNATEMYLAEANSIAELMSGDTAKNLIRVFLLQDKLKSLGNKKLLNLKHVHVIGAGVMGGDIAAWCALRGFKVTLQDREMKYIEPALDRAYKLFERKLKTTEDVDNAVSRLVADPDSKGVIEADVIIEAIFENLEAKQALYRDVEPRMRNEAVLATNTSSIQLELLGEALQRPGRLIGVHFFNPVAKMPLVEVIKGELTDPDMLEKALAFTRHLDKLPVPCNSSPGFLVNRILMPYLMEAVIAAQDGVPLEAIDAAAIDFGMPMGPVELADTVGLDVCLSVAKILGSAYNMPVPALLGDAVALGNLGRKSGKGFYTWVDGKPQKRPSPVEQQYEDLQDRLIFPMLNEAVACVADGVVENADLLDAGVIFGTGFAPFRGGPANYIRTKGRQAMRDRQQVLHDKYGDRFFPHEGWLRI
ncbi:MAG: 3-hydroxyacyl-CoA dehydrogenase NAD-binding domain-containing protein [Gammaproteobacteria bacterium]